MKKYDTKLKKHIEAYGSKYQGAIVVGEIGELLTMFGRAVQGRATIDEWIDEIADCTIMMRQLALMYGVDKVEKRIKEKMERLK